MKSNGLIIIEIWEGLGNQLFQYAYARVLAGQGLNVRLDLNKTYDDFFPKYKKNALRYNNIQKLNITLPEIDVEAYKKYEFIKQKNVWDRILFFLANLGLWNYKIYQEPVSKSMKKFPFFKGNYYVKAWFQDERYLRSVREILLREFTPKKKILISKELRIVLEHEETVSVHVRRGDFIKINRTLPLSYFSNAIAKMQQKYKKPLFLVFSEDINWTRKNLNIGGSCIYVNEDQKFQDYEELFIMSRCKSNIISNSTFSWWGAWLNQNPEKMVIAPKDKWSPKQKNIIPSEWITI